MTAAAKRLLGVNYLYPYQRLVIANILDAAVAAGIGVEGAGPPQAEDQDSIGRQIVVLPTGAGKSLCFQLPALMMKRPTLVVYPILSLQADQERRLRERGFGPVVLRGGQPPQERETAWRRLEAGDVTFAIANPEVLLTEATLRRLGAIRFGHLVLDEAHCVSEWGESFRPSYLRIGEIRAACGAPLCTAFTATASPPVLEKIETYVFGGEGARRILGNPDRPNLRYGAVGTLLRDRSAADFALRGPRPAIVFCSSRAGTERLARYLRARRPKVETRFYHAGLGREEKDQVERWFFSSPQGILVATCAYGLGVDKADIRTVIHRDSPPSVEAYLQESGRAGRDGKAAQALLLWGPEDRWILERRGSGPEKERLKSLMAYGRDAAKCRREALLSMLGASVEYCSGCDVCEGRATGDYRERSSLRGFIDRNRRRYSLAETSELYARNQGGSWRPEEARRAIEFLLEEGDLRRSSSLLWSGSLLPGKSDRERPPAGVHRYQGKKKRLWHFLSSP